ncbi:MAG: hypothetical protein MK137_02805 [Rickettsiales bacterium]|nr:hypothetical protein [Rickettsiales bacterium]
MPDTAASAKQSSTKKITSDEIEQSQRYRRWSGRREVHWQQDEEWIRIRQKESDYQAALASKEFHKSKEVKTNLFKDDKKRKVIISDKSDILNFIMNKEASFTEDERLVLYRFTDGQLSDMIKRLNDRLLGIDYPVAFSLEPNQLIALDLGDKKGENFYRLHMVPLEEKQVMKLFLKELAIPVKLTLRTREPVPGRVITDYIATNSMETEYEEILLLYDNNPLKLRAF